jgi:hypothetical protein
MSMHMGQFGRVIRSNSEPEGRLDDIKAGFSSNCCASTGVPIPPTSSSKTLQSYCRQTMHKSFAARVRLSNSPARSARTDAMDRL